MTFRKASIERSLTTKKHATLSISIVTLPSVKLIKELMARRIVSTVPEWKLLQSSMPQSMINL
jgi:hypothetical protein